MSRKSYYMAFAVVFAVIAVLNYYSFQEHVSSNSQTINEFNKPQEHVEAAPAVAAFFYSADKVKLDAEVNHYLNIGFNAKDYQPSILVVPHTGYDYAKLKPYADKIKRVLLVAPDNADSQLSFLQKKFKKFNIIPLIYDNTAPRHLADTINPYLRSDTLIIFLVDFAKGGGVGVDTAILLAQKNNLLPELINFSGTVTGYGSWMFVEHDNEDRLLAPIEEEEQNIKDFVSLYQNDIKKIAAESLNEALNKGKRYSPDRGEYPDVLFNKGASFITLTQKNGEQIRIGTIAPAVAVANDIAGNTYLAALELKAVDNIGITVSLLTGFERIKFIDEADLLSQITPGIDGLILRDGNRQGLFLPAVWQEIPDKKEFLNQLKIKAGLTPSYQGAEMKIYKFRTVEVK